MKFEDGPYWVQIDSCQSNIEYERKNIMWAKARLIELETSPTAHALCQEYMEDAQLGLSRAEIELEEWMHKHFEFSRKHEEESA